MNAPAIQVQAEAAVIDFQQQFEPQPLDEAEIALVAGGTAIVNTI